MKGVPRDAAERLVASASLANLAFVRSWMVFEPSRWWAYSGVRSPGFTDLAALTLDIGLLGLGLYSLGRLSAASRPARAVAELVLVVLALMIINDVRILLQVHIYIPGGGLTIGNEARSIMLGIVALVTVLCVVRLSSRIAWLVTRGAMILSPLLILSFARASWAVMRPQAPLAGGSISKTAPTSPRVFVYVFDELDVSHGTDYLRQTPGSAIGGLLESSASASAAFSPGLNTRESMASFIIGRPVFRAVETDRGGLRIRETAAGPVSTLSASRTVFELMKQSGLRVGLVGWYLPYCRLRLAESLSRCATFTLLPDQLSAGSFVATMGAFIANRSFASRTLQAVSPIPQRAHHRRLVSAYADSALAFAADTTLDVVVFHVPVPHAPWIQPHSGEGLSGYQANVLRADSLLGATIRAAETADASERPAIILTADHTWREAGRAGSVVDPRVPLLIRFNSTAAGSVHTDTVVTTTLLRLAHAMAIGEIVSADAAIQTMKRSPSTPRD